MSKRETAIDRIAGGHLDVVVIGGGINGAVSAMGLAAHGASVALVDRADFGSGTSQESSNMVWGGFKYLEGYEVPLVIGLCRSRNRLASAYPTRLDEARFLATLDRSSPHRPWFAAVGATAYWALGAFRTAAPRLRRPSTLAALEPTIDTTGARGGVEYSDYLLVDNDARFVSQLAFDAAEHGAAIANYVEVTSIERVAGRWAIELVDTRTGSRVETSAQAVVNATGPRVADLSGKADAPNRGRLVLSKGVHLVVPRITDSGRVLAFYDDERRLFYVLPMGHRSVIGTTDRHVDTADVEVTDDDRTFLLDQINKRLSLPRPLTPDDVIAERCGVRGLVLDGEEEVGGRDWTELSRRHSVEVDDERGVVSVLGGKLSDCLNVGAEVIEGIERCGVALHARPARWFGEPEASERERFLVRAGHVGLDRPPRYDSAATVAEVLWRRHGRRAHDVVALVEADREAGDPLTSVGDHCRAEIEVMAAEEWIVTVDDFLRRRTTLAQLNRSEDLRADPGVVEACRTLLGATDVEAWLAGSDEVTGPRSP